MPTRKRIAILGAGGHAKVVYDAIVRAKLAASMEVRDDDPGRRGADFLGLRIKVPVLAKDLAPLVHVAIGDNRARGNLAGKLDGRKLLAVVHPEAIVSRHALVAPGAFIAAGAVVAPAAKIGECAIINHRAVVDHDCLIGPYAHIAPAATLGGGVKVGEGALVGAGAVVLPGVTIGKWAVVAAGAVVTDAVADSETVYGVPARRKSDA